MSEETIDKAAPRSPVQTRGFRIGALIVIALAVGVVIWLARRDNGNSSSTKAGNVTAVSVGQIRTLAASVAHPVFWVGPKKGFTYELTRETNGTILIRYLPQGVKIGSKKPYLAVATYPFPGAFPAIQNAARASGSASLTIPNHGLAVFAKQYPQSLHAAYPGTNYQVEIYDPKPGVARALLKSGQLKAFGTLKGGSGIQPTKPASASLADLKSLVRSLGQPIYWVGPKAGFTYELTRTSTGKIIIRYLPKGVKVGTQKPYLSVGTYPFPGAFGAIRALTRQANEVAINLPGGGLGVINTNYRKSIHLAYPRSKYEVEVFDPSATRVRTIVSSGQVKTIG
jgi:hypothetical protein